MLSILIYFGLPGALFAAYTFSLLVRAGVRSWAARLFLAVYGLAFPFMALLGYLTAGHVMQFVNRNFVQWQWGYPIDERVTALAIILCGLLTAIALWTVTRSRRVFLVTVGASILVTPIILVPNLFPWHILLQHIVWHGAVGVTMWRWAVQRRRDVRRRAGLCAGCAYDLAGIRTPICPECGRHHDE